MLVRLLYTSDVTPGLTPKDVSRLVSESKVRNRRLDVTGALLKCDHHFVQVLEGREEAVRALMKSIKLDTRHFGVDVSYQEPIATRVFSNWAMSYAERQDTMQDIKRLRAGEMIPVDFVEQMRRIAEQAHLSPLNRM